jgi:hypothetical protein
VREGQVKAAQDDAIKISGERDEKMTMGLRNIVYLLEDERGLVIAFVALIALLIAVSFFKAE